MESLFAIPEDLAALSADELQAFIDETVERLEAIASSPTEYVTAERNSEQLRAEMASAVAAVRTARETLASADGEAEEAGEADEAEELAAEADDEELAADLAALAQEGREAAEAELEETEVEAVVEPEPVTAAAPPAPRRRPTAPARARRAAPQPSRPTPVSLVAAAAADVPAGTELEPLELAEAMVRKHRGFAGIIGEGGEKYAIARADWRDRYPEERVLVGKDAMTQMSLIAAATDEETIRRNFESRVAESLVASGGLCAPVTPYYGLQMISATQRPVRSALPSFNADRGGINAAAPASLADITTGVGQITAAHDRAGGTNATKSCQVVDCPPFSETDVEIIYHCLQFGNLGARTFPERVAQWNQLVMAAHARLAERSLLTGIDVASTAVSASSLGLGAMADWIGEVVTAAEGMRSRHRMADDAVLRVLAPRWILSLLVSDYYRRAYGDFGVTPAQIIALLRANNIEPSFYIDSAAGRNQEFGNQTAAALLPFPSTATWYLYPEGSFLFLDGGTLDLGLVRDSVLNSTNDFQIFGESFESVAFVGVESLAVTSTLCDNGVTGGFHENPCPITYSETS